jgi:hypothetical protein
LLRPVKFGLIGGVVGACLYLIVGWTMGASSNWLTVVFLEPAWWTVDLFRESDAPLWGLVIFILGLCYNLILGVLVGLLVWRIRSRPSPATTSPRRGR